jgi:hypothetical protein
MKNYKYLLRKAKCFKRINGVKVKDIYVDYRPDISRKIYRRYHYKGISDVGQLYSETKLYEFLDDNDANFAVKAKMTNPEKVIYDDFEGDYYWRYFYKIYFSKDDGKTWDKILYDVNNFYIYSPIKDKYDDIVCYNFEKTIDYKVMATDSLDKWYRKVTELVESEFNTYEKCKTHNEVTLDKVMKTNVDSLTLIFKDVDKPNLLVTFLKRLLFIK